LTLISVVSFGQKVNKTRTNQDTTLNNLLKIVPKADQKAFIKRYQKMSPKDRELLSLIAELPSSSKKELIANITTNYQNVLNLIDLYDKLVPTGYSVYIEFNPPEKILKQGESIDIYATKANSNGDTIMISQEWDVELTSNRLDSLINLIHWDRTTLDQIKNALKKANCISIKNGLPTEVGFARSLMGKYSYYIFNSKLSDNDIKDFNDGCTYIFYKDNIVLTYGGGAIGSQCFPDE
jgi:hypothetical protein